MSHKATNWAIQQRGIRPAAKLVLWHLCDRFHPDNGCFPSQATLAEDCELSRSSLNDQLDELESAKLIRREKQQDGATKRRRSTRYRFAFEPGFEAAESSEPCPNFGQGAVSEKSQKPCPKKAESHVRNSDTNPVREPVKEAERERARDDEKEFEKARKAWPTGFVDSREDALAAWQALPEPDQIEAAAEISRFVATTKSAGRRFFGTFASYLAERKWQALPERPKPVSRTTEEREPVAPIRSKPTSFQRKHQHMYPEKFSDKGGAGEVQP